MLFTVNGDPLVMPGGVVHYTFTIQNGAESVPAATPFNITYTSTPALASQGATACTDGSSTLALGSARSSPFAAYATVTCTFAVTVPAAVANLPAVTLSVSTGLPTYTPSATASFPVVPVHTATEFRTSAVITSANTTYTTG